MNKLGVHALVWVGGWSEDECTRAIRSTAELGYDFIETAGFSAAGQVRWRSLADGSVVEANTGGSLAPDLAIELSGTFVVDADSFLL